MPDDRTPHGAPLVVSLKQYERPTVKKQSSSLDRSYWATVYETHAVRLNRLAVDLVGPSDCHDLVADAVMKAVSAPRWAEIEFKGAYLAQRPAPMWVPPSSAEPPPPTERLAEGVETAEAWRQLELLGCVDIQGCFPLPTNAG